MKDFVLIHSNPALDATMNHAMDVLSDLSGPLIMCALLVVGWREKKAQDQIKDLQAKLKSLSTNRDEDGP